jgi:ribonuclease VapC
VIVDTSAVIAILAAEDDAAIYAHAIAEASARRLSAASYLECGIVLDHQRDPVISRSLDELLAEAEFVIEPVTEHHTRLARQPYADFGGGSGHRAGLNFGDCYGTSTRHQLVVCGDPDFIRQVGGPDVAHRLNLQPP